jgi:tetratricopeptide (TPR) repeat protein
MSRRKSEKGKKADRGFGAIENSSDSLVAGAICVALVALVGVVFGQTLRHEFVNYDDDRYIYANPQITRGLSIDGIGSAFGHFQAANWHPLTTISHLADYQFYRLVPWGHHLTSVLLHAIAAVLLFYAMRAMTGQLWPSAFVASVFALHPLRVESVAWVAERKDVLSGVFFMLILWAYARYALTAGPARGRYVLVVVLFSLGLMCKPSLVTVPFVLLLLDYWPLSRCHMPDVRRQNSGIPSLVVEKLPLFVLSAASCAVTLIAQREAFPTIDAIPFWDRCANAVVSYVVYVEQMIYPACLAVLYPYPKKGLDPALTICSLVLLCVISVVCILWRRRYPFLLTGWFWYIGMLIPMIGLVQVGSQARADRYTYLPLIGLSIALTWGTVKLFGHYRGLLATTAAFIVMALATRTWFQTGYWQNGETLWKHAIECTSNNYIAHNNLANWFLQQGESGKAINLAQVALSIQPDLAEAEGTIGNGFLLKGDLEQAVVHYKAALAIKPGFVEIESNLGNILLEKGQVDEAIDHYRKALAANPGYAGVYSNLGNALFRKDEIDEAVTQFRMALDIDPRSVEAHNNLGIALLRKGIVNEAISEFQLALQIRPNYPDAEYNLGRAFAAAGNYREATAHFNEALRIKPGYLDAEQGLRELNGLTK